MTGPATGGRVALTYSTGRLRGLAARLRRDGFQVTRRPLIRVEAAALPAPELVRRAAACPWVLFASPNAVAAWHAWGLPLAGRLVGATGPGTAGALRRLGADVAVVGSPADATGLARAFLAHPLAAGPVALPRGDRALPTLPRLLRAAGVDSVPLLAYRTVPLPWQPRVVPTAVVLASPSALAALPPRVTSAALMVTIGATTSRAARRVAMSVVEAAEPTAEGVWRALRTAVRPRPVPPAPEAGTTRPQALAAGSPSGMAPTSSDARSDNA